MTLTIILLVLNLIACIVLIHSFIKKEQILIKNNITVKQHQVEHMLELATTEELTNALVGRDEPPILVIWQMNKIKKTDQYNYFFYANQINKKIRLNILKKIIETHDEEE